MAVRGGSLPDEISEAMDVVKDWTEERLERSSSRMEVLADGKLESALRRRVVLLSASEALRTVPTRVQSGCWVRRCWMAGIAREPLAPVTMIVPVIFWRLFVDGGYGEEAMDELKWYFSAGLEWAQWTFRLVDLSTYLSLSTYGVSAYPG